MNNFKKKQMRTQGKRTNHLQDRDYNTHFKGENWPRKVKVISAGGSLSAWLGGAKKHQMGKERRLTAPKTRHPRT